MNSATANPANEPSADGVSLDERHVSPIENEVPPTTAALNSDEQSLSEGLFLPFGLEDSRFYRDGSSRISNPEPARAANVQMRQQEAGGFYDGLIPVDEDEVSPITPISPFPGLNHENGPLESNLSRLLEPQHFAAPAPRWTIPPQWLQFQMLRNYDDGLMVAENQSEPPISFGLTRSIYPDEVDRQVQFNLNGLLQQRSDTDASARWEVLPQWLQTSLDQDSRSSIEPQTQEFDDGLIAVDEEAASQVLPDREASISSDERQMQENLLSLLPPLQAQTGTRSPPPSLSPTTQTAEKYSLPEVTCHFGLMRRTGIRDRNLEFNAEGFSSSDRSQFSKRLHAHASKSIGLMFLIVTDWQLWFLDSFRSALPDFPIQILLHLSSPKASTMLPTIDHNEAGNEELSCIMEHINTRDKTHEKPDNETEIDVGLTKAQCLPLVVWTRAERAIEGRPDQPLIVVVSRCKRDISSQITGHYSFDDYKRWDRLNGNHAWVYLDMYFLFTKWDRVWGAVKQNLSLRTEEVIHGYNSVMPIMEQTRLLHKDNNVMISLREHVRIHKASLKIVKQRVENFLGGPEWLDTQHLKGRLGDAFELLDYYDVTATTLMEQQQNLLSLAFNLENVAQGQAVARLNVLAFVFLPLSYVASIFGITTFTASPKWYPAAAVPVLLTTIFLAYIAHQYFTSKATQTSSNTSPNRGHQADIERHTRGKTQLSPLWSKLTRPFSRSRPSLVENQDMPSFDLNNITVNDPSRIVRRPTERSLAERQFVPPKSTVQYLPNAYDLSSGLIPPFTLESQTQDTSITATAGVTNGQKEIIKRVKIS